LSVVRVANRGSLRSRSSGFPGTGLLGALEGFALLVWNLIATPFVGQRRRRWGTVGSEADDPLTGDELIPDPKWSYTLGVTIDAPPEAVWPWIAQIGQGRGGFYTYQALENLVGCRITNTSEILADYQHPAVGEGIHLHWDAPPLRIETVEPPYGLVLFGSPVDVGSDEVWGVATWQFIIKPDSDGGSRLLTRGRYDHAPNRRSRLLFGRFPMEVITFVMSRKMMLEMKRLAENRVGRGAHIS
jgi:hypothetical protein